ncbi:hypothetical protein BDV93DRAFT_526638, partial [Ceratobasidium sp. AG-I]
MEPRRIAPELLLLILEHIPSPMIQAKLCLLDSQTRELIVPILYKVCDINQLEGVSAFCKAIKEDSYLGIHVEDLKIHCVPPTKELRDGEDMSDLINAFGLIAEHKSNEPQWTEDHVSDLRDALGLLPNLDILMLAYGKGLSSVFDGLEVPFQLKTLAIVHFRGAAFVRFLQNQKSIESLRIRTLRHGGLERTNLLDDSGWGWDTGYYDPDPAGAPDSVIEAAADPAFLPNLSFLATEPLKCTGLAPGRPITHVVIMQNVDSPSLRDDRYRDLALALGRTSVPLEYLEFTPQFTKPRELTSWDFLDLVCETDVPNWLRALVLHDNEGNLVGYAMRHPFLQHKARLLGEKFKVLERFEVPRRYDTMGLISKQPFPNHYYRFFGTMGELSAWQE